MLREEIKQVKAMAREIAKEEIAKALAEYAKREVTAPTGVKLAAPSKKSTKYE